MIRVWEVIPRAPAAPQTLCMSLACLLASIQALFRGMLSCCLGSQADAGQRGEQALSKTWKDEVSWLHAHVIARGKRHWPGLSKTGGRAQRGPAPATAPCRPPPASAPAMGRGSRHIAGSLSRVRQARSRGRRPPCPLPERPGFAAQGPPVAKHPTTRAPLRPWMHSHPPEPR